MGNRNSVRRDVLDQLAGDLGVFIIERDSYTMTCTIWGYTDQSLKKAAGTIDRLGGQFSTSLSKDQCIFIVERARPFGERDAKRVIKALKGTCEGEHELRPLDWPLSEPVPTTVTIQTYNFR
ncbi:hypothetical protein I302_105323 [Kwoniella bestiolae CBS 10118]|uniref:Uncharacterized protein n=1 Tax=Kwoniella bestiolae CBS 10118 TaxID=1296100 RepID=A0A1B9FSV3_9TREE|nr:hypothetical protein I302_08609 [Kwoniella bestiolae CBS 10118]OCF21830.1 hypothetical protein I302_08609 [Kwoniella bestiolae CBS 10118]